MHAKFQFLVLHPLSYLNLERRWQKNLNVFCIIISLSKTLTFSYISKSFSKTAAAKTLTIFPRLMCALYILEIVVIWTLNIILLCLCKLK